VRAGEWSSYSYHCGGQGPGLIGGGWENMDRGDGFYNGPILPLGLTYNTSAASLADNRWKRVRSSGSLTAL
jgi:hypothetical protein